MENDKQEIERLRQEVQDKEEKLKVAAVAVAVDSKPETHAPVTAVTEVCPLLL